MKKLIYLEDAKKAACKALCKPGASCPDTFCKEINEAFDAIPTQPEIIRCEDCKYWDVFPTSSLAPEFHKCKGLGVHTVAGFFCRKGERRTDE